MAMADNTIYDLLDEVFCAATSWKIWDVGTMTVRHISWLFKELLYDGGDPMEFRDYLVKVQKACKGEWPCWH